MKVALVTDVWHPQVNGLVHTWQHMQRELAELGHELAVLHPGLYPSRPLPRYPENRLVMRPWRAVREWLAREQPDAIHLATEGPLGLAMRQWCRQRDWPFTSSYHARLTVVLPRYARVPTSLVRAYVRWFHGAAATTLAPAASVCEELHDIGVHRVAVWKHGVDTHRFRICGGGAIAELPRPIFLYVGRVAWEKDLADFLKLDLPGSKVVVGDGPAMPSLRKRFPQAHWQGYRTGDELVRHYNDADVMVFPSRTDTFGMVLLEANACGLPVAAYPTPGPVDVVDPGVSGVLDDDLRRACMNALKLDSDACRRHAQQFSWAAAGRALVEQLAPAQPQQAVA
ncbi:glycosyltransferase family 4 protein [Phycisphaerales bacterium AB-hyl4]|uniref:Glycosyltransferase family 4 protein n=1 Tax=Natronomicrosphaera hydrolytica TaxID=3242702 RepID=A0ABV4U8Q1_9BACT